MHIFHVQPLTLPHCTKTADKKHLKGSPASSLHFTRNACVTCADSSVFSDVKDYHRDLLPPVTAQASSRASAVASILERHAAELSATQEWDNDWKSQGLLSRLTPQVEGLTVLVLVQF